MNVRSVFLLIALLLCGWSLATSADPSVWKSYSKALTQSAKDHKPVLIEFYADWCGPCKIMERTSLRDSSVVKLLGSKFHAVRINVEEPGNMLCENTSLSIEDCVYSTWEIPGIPAFATVDAHGRLQRSFVGMMDAQELEQLLLDFLVKDEP